MLDVKLEDVAAVLGVNTPTELGRGLDDPGLEGYFNSITSNDMV